MSVTCEGWPKLWLRPRRNEYGYPRLGAQIDLIRKATIRDTAEGSFLSGPVER